MKKRIILLTTLTLIFLSTGSPAFSQWPKYVVDDHVDMAINVDIGDIDGDTRPDIIAPAHGNDKFQ